MIFLSYNSFLLLVKYCGNAFDFPFPPKKNSLAFKYGNPLTKGENVYLIDMPELAGRSSSTQSPKPLLQVLATAAYKYFRIVNQFY